MTRRQILKRLYRDARPYYPRIFAAFLLGALAGVTQLAFPQALGLLQDHVLNHEHSTHLLYLILVGTFVLLTLSALGTYGNTYLMAWSGQHLIAKMRVRLFGRVLQLPLSGFDKWRPGELISRFSYDLQLMTDAVTISLPQLVQNSFQFIASLIYMLEKDWLLTLALIGVAPVVSFAVSKFQRLISHATLRAQERIADLSANLAEILQGQRVVKAFNRESYEIDRFRSSNERYFGTYMKLTQFIATQPLVVSTIMLIAIVFVIWFSAREVLSGRLSSGNLLAYWAALVLLINPMNRFAAFTGEIEKALVGTGRVYEILDLPIEREDHPDARALGTVSGAIVFEHVKFTYSPDEPPVLNDFCAQIAAGEIVALVGPSGAGKTTIVNLVPRFYEPQQGRITLDGVNLNRLRLADLRGAIGIVPQEAMLFRGTIADNIRYGRLDADDDEVRSAAREANADEFVSAFPDGYLTEVGERGIRLSGGQRQRISIARAILRDPRILILDEATSALDSHSEALIEEALDRLLPGRTTLIIAHRLSTIRRANTILYIEAGSVKEVGSHESLLAAGGAYARLHATQFAGQQPA